MLLARRGYRVLLVDRAPFPSDIHQGHFIHKQGPRLLKNWGLLERLEAKCPPVTSQATDFGDFLLTGKELVVDGVAWGYGPRRMHLDEMLVEAAMEAGAEFRPNFLVEEYFSDGDALAGIRGREARGSAAALERARITIGADGRNSALARTVRASSYEETPPLTCWYFSYWSGVRTGGFEMYVRPRRVVFSFSTSDNLFAIFIACPIQEFAAVRADVEGEFMKALDLAPDLAERVRAGRREERFYGAADLPNFLRRPFGPGWALVGDAGSHKDPYLALGICDALRDAELVTAAVHEGLSGERPLEEALRAYESARNSAVLEDYRQNIALAKLGPTPPELVRLRMALRDDPQETRRFILAREGMIPPEQFFNPENMARLLAKAGLEHPPGGNATVSA
jgi:flavin-dependent dehydrogenase